MVAGTKTVPTKVPSLCNVDHLRTKINTKDIRPRLRLTISCNTRRDIEIPIKAFDFLIVDREYSYFPCPLAFSVLSFCVCDLLRS